MVQVYRWTIKRCLTIVLLGLVWCGGLTASAQAQEVVKLWLTRLQAEALSEENGDEVYISVTKYSTAHRAEEFRIPSAPDNWQFKQLDKVANVPLWEGSLNKGEEIKLMISVVEQDFPPWDVDDLVGTVQLDLKEVQGKVIKTWHIPQMDGQPKIDDRGPFGAKGRSYVLHGDNSRYEMELTLQDRGR